MDIDEYTDANDYMGIDEFKAICLEKSIEHFGCECQLLWSNDTDYIVIVGCEVGKAEFVYNRDTEEVTVTYYNVDDTTLLGGCV